MSKYGVKEIFVTLQGEGHRAGTKAVFIRFTGCNMWDGMPLHRDRGAGACAAWCDTDFFKGQVLSADEIVAAAGEAWGMVGGERWCVLTGGEPCLQVDRDLIAALHNYGWHIAVETNGTVENRAVEESADWVCLAPKLAVDGTPTMLAFSRANEVKVVLPGVVGGIGWTPEMLRALERAFPGAHLFVQPQDPLVHSDLVEETALKRTKDLEHEALEDLARKLLRNTRRCIDWVMNNPHWRVSWQSHKVTGLK